MSAQSPAAVRIILHMHQKTGFPVLQKGNTNCILPYSPVSQNDKVDEPWILN